MCSSATFTCSLPQIKAGHLLHYKRRLFGSNWREVYVALYQDSSLAWYENNTRHEAKDWLQLREAPEFIAVGQFTARVPGRPVCPAGVNFGQLMVFGKRFPRHLYWFIARSDDEVNAWMIAIASTLPAPPISPSAPPAYAEQPPNQQYGPIPQHQTYSNGPVQMGNNYLPHRGPVYPTPGRAPQNTVIVQNNDSSVGDIATGMMLGAALSSINRPSFGYQGFGWGCGGGWGLHSQGHNFGPSFVNQDVNITNNFNVNETVVNNDVEFIDQRNNFVPEDGYDFNAGEGVEDWGGVDPGLMEDFEF